MRFGVIADPSVSKIDTIVEAEKLGYHRAWIPDSQMIWSDCYVTMTLAAQRTSRILLGTGVTNPATRIAPVAAGALASINKIAPGRLFMGLGTGHTSMRVMGQPPAKLADMREYARVARTLLAGDAVNFTMNGRTREIQFLHQDRDYYDLEHQIPIYIAATGPNALALAAEEGDGWITGGLTPDMARACFGQIKASAEKAGRRLPTPYPTLNIVTACLLRPGEELTDPRIIDITGSMVVANLHFFYEIWDTAGRPDHLIPEGFSDIWDEYVARADGFMPRETRYRQIHEGHATFLVEEERKFITPKGIRHSCLVGNVDEMIEQIHEMEDAGIEELAILPPSEFQPAVFREFAETVMPRLTNRPRSPR